MKRKIRNILIDFSKKNIVFRIIIRKLIYLYKSFKFLRFFVFKKVNEKTIIFESFMGKAYADSPKFLYLEMLNDEFFNDYTFIWAFKDTNNYQDLLKNKNTKLIKHGSNQYYDAYSKSKYWITNSRIPEFILKKKNQKYIQTWHGTPLKKIGFDITVEGGNALNTIEEIRYKYSTDAKRYDYMISPSKFCSEKFISAFNLKKLNQEKVIIEKGYPRNDILFKFSLKDVDTNKKKLGIPKNKKVILYAPTWRDNQHTTGVGYTYELKIDFEKLQKELSDRYVILFKAHYFIANSFDFEKYEGFIYDVSNVDDISDLYIISDIIITDYSSVFFDYANLKRPMLFYMYDQEQYQNELRDFYFNINILPGPITKNEDELVNEINNLDSYHKNYKNKYDSFNSKFNYLDNKNTSKEIIKEIFKK